MNDHKFALPVLSEKVHLIDTHCHLDMADYADDLDDIIERARNHRVEGIVTIGIDINSSKKAIKLARAYPGVWASVGIHPHDLPSTTDSTYADLAQLVEENQEYVVAYGEIGLDYVKQYCPPEMQREHFRIQLELASTLDLPVVIHDREAHEDILRIVSEHKPLSAGGVLHCFSGDYTMARKAIDLGLSLSIPGIVTYKNAVSLQEVARKIPLSSMLIETDGPFLAPQPWRGKRNEPAYLAYTAARIAELRAVPVDLLADATTANASALFNLSLPKPERDTVS